MASEAVRRGKGGAVGTKVLRQKAGGTGGWTEASEREGHGNSRSKMENRVGVVSPGLVGP